MKLGLLADIHEYTKQLRRAIAVLHGHGADRLEVLGDVFETGKRMAWTRGNAEVGVMIGKLVSGGQTGVDRAALDVALELGVPRGGWCPRGRIAEDGRIPDHYPLTETPSSDYSERTRWNVRDSDATLILTWGEPTGGTLLTLYECRKAERPHLVIDLAGEGDMSQAVRAGGEWIATNLAGAVLNVAGPRGSEHPTVYDLARGFLRALLGETD